MWRKETLRYGPEPGTPFFSQGDKKPRPFHRTTMRLPTGCRQECCRLQHSCSSLTTPLLCLVVFQVMQSTHYYLVDTSRITPGTAVSQLLFEVISTAPFTVEGLQVHHSACSHVCS